MRNSLRRRLSGVAIALALGATAVGVSASSAHADQYFPGPVPAYYYSNGCSMPPLNVLLDQNPPLVDPSPWAFPYVFVVNFRSACDMHDAAYEGGIVYHPATGALMDTRTWSRSTADLVFRSDLKGQCNLQIGANAQVARALCYAIAETYYAAVRAGASGRFDANPFVPGIQASGPRVNN